MKIIKYEPVHLSMIKLQPKQAEADLSEEFGQYLSEHLTLTGLNDDGEVIAIGGLLPVWGGRCILHLLVSENITHHWTSIYRIAKWLIAKGLEDYHRLEALSTFDESDRWLKLLGFRYEGVLYKVMPDGKDAKSYSITKG